MKPKIAILAALTMIAVLAVSCGKKQDAAAEKPPVVTGARVEKVAVSQV